MPSRHEQRDAALTRSLETATRELAMVRDELLKISASLPFTKRRAALQLDAAARRLTVAIEGLSLEVMVGPDPEASRLYLRLGRKALTAGAAAVFALGSGMAQGAGFGLYNEFADAASAADRAVEQADTESAHPDAAPGGDFGEDEEDEAPQQDDDLSSGLPRSLAAEVIGLTPRQLDYWDRTGLVRPSLTAQDSRAPDRYSTSDLVELQIAKLLLDVGVGVEGVRAAKATYGDLASLDGQDPVVIAGRVQGQLFTDVPGFESSLSLEVSVDRIRTFVEDRARVVLASK